MCSPSILLIFRLCSHLGSRCPSPNSSMLVDTSCLKGTCSPRVEFPQVPFHWVFVLTKGVWQIRLAVFILSWGETVYHSSAILSTYVFFRVSLHPYPSACIRWVVGYHSCPLWQTADKFSWVRLSEGRGGWGQG